MLPTPHPDSAPFLLVRPVAAEPDVAEAEDESSIPPRSVPPRAPPASTSSLENDLPSVIVDLETLQREEEEMLAAIESQRASDVDVLLEHADAVATREAARQQTLPSIEPREPSRWRSIGVGLLAITLVGGACFELRAHGVSAREVRAALHLR